MPETTPDGRRSVMADLIAHGQGMIRRLEQEAALSLWERERLPEEERVPIVEAVHWEETVERVIFAGYSTVVRGRLELFSTLYQDELDRGDGDDLTRALRRYRRVVQLLKELEPQ